MSSRKMFMIPVLATLCMMFAVNVFAQAQKKDKKPDNESSAQTTATVTVTTTEPQPVDMPSEGAVPASPATSTGTTTAVPNGLPDTFPRRAGPTQYSTGQTFQLRQNSQIERNAQAAIQKAQEEMQKARMQFEKSLKELEKNNNPEAIQKAQEEMQKSMLKAQEEIQKAKAQLDKIGQEFRSIQVGPGGAQLDVFGTGGGFGGGMGIYGGNSGRSAGGVVLDNGKDQIMVSGPGAISITSDPVTNKLRISGPGAISIASDPETKEFRDKEQECTDKIGKIVDHYNSTPATTPGDRAAIRTELEKAVSEQFDIRQKYRELQIKQLEKELARVRDSIQKRNENREQIIKRHIAQLLHEQEDLEF